MHGPRRHSDRAGCAARSRARVTIAAVALVVLLVSASEAPAATTTVGEMSLAPNGASTLTTAQDSPVFQGDSGGGYAVSAPHTGTITSWSFLSAGITTGKHFVLRVLAPTDASGTTWRALATSDAVAVTSVPGLDAVNGPFPASIPIQAGDRVALQPVDDGVVPIEQGSAHLDGVRFFDSAFADGTTAPLSPASSTDNGQIVPIQATIDYVPAPSGPVNTGLPTISGTQRQFETLSATPGLWKGGVNSFAFQWFRCSTATSCAPIAGAGAASYTLTKADIGAMVKVRVSATNLDGTTSADSALSGVIELGVVTARLSISPNPTCTGLTVHIDGSGSVSPDGIASYRISEVRLDADGAENESDARNGAFANALALVLGVMNPYEIASRTYATFTTPSVNVTFDWNRPALPAYPGDQAGFTSFARDPVGIVLDVRDFAGATDRAVSAISFAQIYSDLSRSGCPRRSVLLQRLALPALIARASLALPAHATARTSKLTTTLSCTQRVACTGELSVTALNARCARCAADGRSAAARGGPVRAPAVIARSFFSIAPHRKKLITSSLTPTGFRALRALRRGASRRLQVTIVVVGPTGKRLLHTYTITVKRK